LASVDVGNNSAPAFADVDSDGDQDCLIGNFDGLLKYYKNTGTATVAAFSEQTGANNPFSSIDIGLYSAPTFTNIDNDADVDLIVGKKDGGFSYFEITLSNLPVNYLSFTAKKQNTTSVLLNWSTSFDKDAQDFIVQHSIDGINWKEVGFIAADLTSNSLNSTYQFLHTLPATGTNYYRLLSYSKTGAAEYSTIKTVQFSKATAGFTLRSNMINNGVIQINVPTPSTVRLLTNTGQLVQEFNVPTGNHSLNLTKSAKGLYILSCNGQNESLIIR
jgi:hypothetical protein